MALTTIVLFRGTEKPFNTVQLHLLIRKLNNLNVRPLIIVAFRNLAACIVFSISITFRAFSRCFYPKRLTISAFVRRKGNNISLSVQ